MSCPIVLQSTASSITIYLETTAGAAATGLTFSDVSCDLKKEGAGSFSAKTLSGANFTEVGGGTYALTFTTSDTDTLGNMYVRITGATINTVLQSVFIAEATPTVASSALTIPTTNMFGYVVGSDGSPLAGAAVSARVLATPSVGTSGGEGYVSDTTLQTAKTDSDGYFVMSLVTGAQVDFFIPAANYRRTFTVPTSSTNVFDLS